MRSICVFCGSNTGANGAYAQAARGLAAAIVARGLRLVYGGGSIGLMGVVAGTALAAGGEVIGVTPRQFVEREVIQTGLTALHVVETLLERKALMAELSDGFVSLPGGLGTLDELFEMLTWTQLGIQSKPCGLLDVNGYYAQLSAFLDYAVSQHFIRPEHRSLLICGTDPADLLDRLANCSRPDIVR